jgi:predicted phage tail protein
MRTRSTVLITALVLCVSACGRDAGRSPAAPSMGITMHPGAAPGTQASAPVSWSCFTSGSASSAFGPAGCPTRTTTSRLLPASTGAPIIAPNPPTSLTATVSGSVVTLNWSAPVGGDAPTSYQIQAGSSSGQTNIATFDTGTTSTTLAIFNVPAGTYFVRVRGVNSAGASGASNEIQVVVGGTPPCSPVSPPSGLIATINGGTVTLSWTAPTTGCTPTSYIIQAGSAPGLTNLANFDTGSPATTFTATNVPAGTYYVRIQSAAPGNLSPSSTEIAFTVGVCGTAPAAPTSLQAVVSGSTIVFAWTAPSGGCAATSYLLQAGSSPGASNLANSPVSGTTLTATNVGNGTYYVRVIAVNAVGQSPASNEVVVTLPPTPTSLVAGFQFFDPATQTSPTTFCRIVSALALTPTVCEARSTSFATGTNTIASYTWTVDYFYGTQKTFTQTGTNPNVQILETCGGPGSTDDGAAVPVTITLTVTDSLGATATVTSGTGVQPPLTLRLFKC